MADNELTVVIADESTKTLRSRDTGAGHAQKVDIAAWRPTLVAGHQYDLEVSTSVVTLTVPSGATHVLLSVDGAPVRMREDDADPTADNGILLPDGFVGELAIPGTSLRFISDTGTEANLNASYRKYT